jgi:hypothetical protein
MSRNTEMERGAPEQQMAAYQRRIRKILTIKNVTEQRKFDILVYNIQPKWDNRVKKRRTGVRRRPRMKLYVGSRGYK